MFLNQDGILDEPYVFKSGKNTGKSAEKVFFDDPAFIYYIYNNFINTFEIHGNEFQKHIKWIVDRANLLNPTLLCPHCQKKPVRFFIANFNHGNSPQNQLEEGVKYSFCNESKCKEKAKKLPLNQIAVVYPIKYFVLDKFSTKCHAENKYYAELFKIFHEIPSKLTPHKAFKILKSES